MVVFDWVGGIHCSNSAHTALILDCRFLLNQFAQVKFNHCFREANYRMRRCFGKVRLCYSPRFSFL